MKEQADKGKGQPSPKGKGKAKSRGKGKSAKSRDDAAVRQLEQFGWICVVGHEEAEAEEPQAAEPVAVDPPEADEDPAAEIERLSAKTGWEKTQDGDPVLVKRGRTVFQTPAPRFSRHKLRTTWIRREGQWVKCEDRVEWRHLEDPSSLILDVGDCVVTVFHKITALPEPVDSSPGHLTADSKVGDLKARLKQLSAPIWGTKAQLWERLQEREAEVEYHRSVEAQKHRREEDLNKDPEGARQPMVLAGPEAPSVAERELHELTHLPYAPWCESCVRGRGRDLPHRKVEPPERRLMPMLCQPGLVCGSNLRRAWSKGRRSDRRPPHDRCRNWLRRCHSGQVQGGGESSSSGGHGRKISGLNAT